MGATIEKSLCIGILKTRFDLFDYVELELNDCTIVKGEIVDFEEKKTVWIDTKKGRVEVNVDDIKDYIS